MRNAFLIFAAVFLSACTKEKTFGPWKLKDGQQIEVMVSHRYGAVDDRLTLVSHSDAADIALHGFGDRQPGYNYRILARMVVPSVPPQDGPTYWMEFVSVLSSEKYEENQPFIIELVHSSRFGGSYISLIKDQGQYHFIPEKITLTSADVQVNVQLEQIWEHNRQILEIQQALGSTPKIKWRSVRARVTHDVAQFGKSYLVSEIAFSD